jgi:hypothetical protein
MTKSESKEVANVVHAYRAGYCDAATAARALSTLERAARTDKSCAAIRDAADSIGVRFHSDYKA